MKPNKKKQSLYVTLGIIIFTTVTLVISLQSAYTYISTKNKIINSMKHDSETTIASLQKNIVNLISSYAVNEYENIVLSEMELNKYFAIIIEDYNMGKILGKPAYISGRIRNNDGKITDYNPESNEQQKKLEQSFYSRKGSILSIQGEKLGSITVYITDEIISQELNTIIYNTIIKSVLLSLTLIISLFITIRLFILKPVSNIISTIDKKDDEGIPTELVPNHGAREIFHLANTINNMVFSIRNSRVKLDEQYNTIRERDDEILTLSKATEQSPASILICSPDNIIEYANPQFEKTSGYSFKELSGKSIEPLFQNNARDIERITALKKALAAGKRWQGELTPKSKHGKNYVIQLSASAISNDQGQTTHHIFLAEDITEQKINEEILRNTQKMDAIGQLTGGIAHDFNNLLGIILGNLELLKMTIGDHPEHIEKIDNAIAGADRGATLTRKLLNFSRQTQAAKEITQVNHFIENLHELISKSVTTAVQVELQLDDNLWPVEVDSGDLQDAILNLSLNARDAMPNGGVIEIKTTNKHLDSNYISQNPEMKQGDYIMISVSDNGTGIPDEVKKNIFEPFYTTKEIGKGTGLGLSMVYSFVQRSNGYIQVYSEEDHGTTFNIYLPRSFDNNDDKSIDISQVIPRGNNEVILIVDDEDKLANAAKYYLEHLGYQAIITNSGDEALTVLKQRNDIDLIFSDVIMPGINGFELAFTALELIPGIKILLTSGFTSKHIKYSDKKEIIYNKLAANLLEKPYTLNEIAIAIHRTFDE